MPKKRNHIPYSKPQTSAHPSISRSSNNHHNNDSIDEQDSQKSVNDLLQHLRISQAPSVVSTESRSDVNPKILHPAISNILQIPATPAPRPRPGMRSIAAPGRRRPPGPAPPRSWLEGSNHTPTHLPRASTRHNLSFDHRPNLETLPPLPDTLLPNPRSLQHLTLLHLAKNWDFHVEYDQYYLAALPVRTKQTLLTYIARYSPNGISLHGLQTLFLSSSSSHLPDATGAEGLTHLDLSGSISRSISFQELKHFITTTLTPYPTTTTTTSNSGSLVPDSWDVEDSSSPTTIPLSPFPRTTPGLTTLTHLSLAHPPPHTTPWRSLLSLAPSLHTLTHLSLAFFPPPPPSLHPNATTASPAGTITYAPPNLDPHTLDRDHAGSASVLRRLARQTYCLQYLDLTGCSEWIPALACREGGGVEWEGAWSGMRTVKVAQGWVPGCLEPEEGGGKEWEWVAVLTYEGSEPRKKEETRALRRWLSWEVEMEGVGRTIREDRAKTVGEGRRWDDGDWQGPIRSSGAMGQDKAQKISACRVVFDRGWEEGRVFEKCIKLYKARTI